MRRTLLQWLCCPACGGGLRVEDARELGAHIMSGLLRCDRCGTYPIIDGVPRFVSTAPHPQTQRSFGFQWTRFSKMHGAFEQSFLNYVEPLRPEMFRGRLALDAGCGFGRHLYYAASYGAEAIGVDVSEAVNAAFRTTAHLPTAHVVQADLYHLPFKPGMFDLIYSLGVLHHLPRPEAAFHQLLRYLAPGGRMAVWVYSAARQGINTALECARRVTTRLPLPVLLWLSWAAGLLDWALFILPYRLAYACPLTHSLAERLAWPRVRLYAAYPLDVCVADWFDRLSAPLRFYYTAVQLAAWCEHQPLTDVRITPTGRYGWRLQAHTWART